VTQAALFTKNNALYLFQCFFMSSIKKKRHLWIRKFLLHPYFVYFFSKTNPISLSEVKNEVSQWDSVGSRWDSVGSRWELSGNSVGTRWDYIRIVYGACTEHGGSKYGACTERRGSLSDMFTTHSLTFHK
jgi:hypothetical protein